MIYPFYISNLISSQITLAPSHRTHAFLLQNSENVALYDRREYALSEKQVEYFLICMFNVC